MMLADHLTWEAVFQVIGASALGAFLGGIPFCMTWIRRRRKGWRQSGSA
jgi:hypothetical protein